jgi:hypothetical protein
MAKGKTPLLCGFGALRALFFFFSQRRRDLPAEVGAKE